MAGLSYQERKAKGQARRLAKKSLETNTATFVVALPVSVEELEMLTRKEQAVKVNRKVWAEEVLALVQSRPNKWLKLGGKQTSTSAPRYLKPLGIKYHFANSGKGDSGLEIYVKWEVK